MRYSLDTSAVMRLLVTEIPRLHEVMLKFLDDARMVGDDILVSDLVIAETYFALQHHYGSTKADALEVIRRLLSTGEIRASGHASAILRLPNLEKSKPGFVDRLIHADSMGAGCHWVTFEKSAGKLPDTLVLKIS